jgi:multicopper oxidase
VTLNRGSNPIPATERLVRKDVWRLRPDGRVTFQVQFGEYGGSYVSHCHNAVHEDFAMLMRIQLLTGLRGSPQVGSHRYPEPEPRWRNLHDAGNSTGRRPTSATQVLLAMTDRAGENHCNLRLLREEALDDAQQLERAVGLGHVMVAPGRTGFLLISLHGK